LEGPEKAITAALESVKAAGKEPHTAFGNSELGTGDFNARWNVMTGGGNVVNDWYPFGRFIDLADTNWDHFSFNGRTWSAYSAGHSLAMEAAVVAHTLAANKAPEEKIAAQLLHAYVYDAFAQHFLTDSWAAGHIRTPRKYLTKQTTPGDVGSYLARYMHDEDNWFGLNVTNLRGDKFRAYGDTRLLDAENRHSRMIAEEAVQMSRDEVHACFLSGELIPDSANYTVAQLYPILHPGENFSPMFKWDGHTLLRRDSLNDLWSKKYDKHGAITGWYSISTLAELEVLYGPPHDLPPPPSRFPWLRNSALFEAALSKCKQEEPVHENEE